MAKTTGSTLSALVYTPWRTRVLAAFVDWAPVWLIVFVVPSVGVLATDGAACLGGMYSSQRDHCTTSTAELWLYVQLFGLAAGAAYFLWNFAYRQGRTGQSVGKSAFGFRVVAETTGAPIGFGLSLARQVVHYLDQAICYIGYLWPLWDAKRQTLADKIMGTICVPVVAEPRS